MAPYVHPVSRELPSNSASPVQLQRALSFHDVARSKETHSGTNGKPPLPGKSELASAISTPPPIALKVIPPIALYFTTGPIQFR